MLPRIDAHVQINSAKIIEGRNIDLLEREIFFNREFRFKDDRTAFYSGLFDKSKSGKLLGGLLDRSICYGFSSISNHLNEITNDELLELSERDQRIIPVASVNPAGWETIDRQKLSEFFGIHFKPSWVNVPIDSPLVDPLLKWLTQNKKPLFLHSDYVYLDSDHSSSINDPRRLYRVLKKFDTLEVYIEHCGGGLFLAEFYEPYRKLLENVRYSTASPRSPLLVKLALEYLPENKVHFGSDYPYCDHMCPAEYFHFLCKLLNDDLIDKLLSNSLTLDKQLCRPTKLQ